MISEKVKQELKKNWGDRADALQCYCEVKYQDPISSWSCFIYAMNPDNEDEICCLIMDKQDIEVIKWNVMSLMSTYNRYGEYPVIDKEFRRIHAAVLYKKLGGR